MTSRTRRIARMLRNRIARALLWLVSAARSAFESAKRGVRWIARATAQRLSWTLERLFGLYRSHTFNGKVTGFSEEVIFADLSDAIRQWGEVFASDPAAMSAPSIGRSYDSAVARLARTEAKAVGLVQVAAVVAAILAITLGRNSNLIRIFSIVALVYLALGTWGALLALKVRTQPQLLVRDAHSDTRGLAETAAAAEGMEVQSIRTTNLVTGAYSDIQRGGAAAALALLLVIAGVGATKSNRDPVLPGPPGVSVVVDVSGP